MGQRLLHVAITAVALFFVSDAVIGLTTCGRSFYTCAEGGPPSRPCSLTAQPTHSLQPAGIFSSAISTYPTLCNNSIISAVV